jgi:hypothetical protein
MAVSWRTLGLFFCWSGPARITPDHEFPALAGARESTGYDQWLAGRRAFGPSRASSLAQA